MSANISVTTQPFSVDVNTSTNTINVSSTPNTVELTLEPKLTIQQLRNNLFADSPLAYDASTGTFDLDEDAIDSIVVDSIVQSDIKLKSVSETVVDAGDVSGTVTLDVTDGTIFTANVTGNITQIDLTNALPGSTTTLLLRQDSAGNHQLETGLLGDWIFTDNNSNLETDPLAFTIISVFYTGTRYVASVTAFVQKTSDSLPEGTTNLYFTDARARNAISVTAPLLYDQANGILSADTSGFGASDTDELPEGNVNLYFTTQRARDSVSAGGDLSYSNATGVFSVTTYKSTDFDSDFAGKTTTDLSEGSNLYYTDARVQSLLDTGVVDALFTGDVNIQGNLEVLGNVDYVTVDDLLVKDHEIVLNFGNASAQDAFITVDRSGSALSNAQIRWNESTDAWEFSNDGSVYQAIPASTSDLSEGTNLYYTDGRANSAIGAYQGDINTTGNITAGVFFGDGGNLSNIDTGANLATSTTDDLAEGNTNLYYTDARARDSLSASGDLGYDSANGVFSVTTYKSTDFDADFGAKTTDDLDEGAVNLYYADARARAAISSGDDNIDYANGVITLSNTLTNVNSISASENNFISLNTADSQDRQILGAVIDNPGWAYNAQSGIDGNGTDWFSYTGNADLYKYEFSANTTQGSNVIQVDYAQRRLPNDQTDPGISVDQIPLGSIILDGFNVVAVQQDEIQGTAAENFPFDPPVVVQSVDAANSTITVNKPANQTAFWNFGEDRGALGAWPGGYDAANDFALVIEPDYLIGGTDTTAVNRIVKYPQGRTYAYPDTGFTSDDFVWAVEDANSYEINASVLSEYMESRIKFTPDNSAPLFTRGFTVGPKSVLSNRGLNEDPQLGFGFVMNWDGLAEDFPQTWRDSPSGFLAPQMLLNTYSDRTFTGGAGRLFFQSFTGNANDPLDQQYPRAGQGLGRVQWGGPTQNQYLTVSTNRPAAALQAYAASDWIDRGFGGAAGLVGNTNVYLNATTNNQVGNDLFLSFEEGELFLAAGNHGTLGARPISMGPARPLGNFGADPVGTYDANSTRWATVNYANTSAQSGSKFTVTNGGSAGPGIVGDMEVSFDRVDNTGNVVVNLTSQFGDRFFNQGLLGQTTAFISPFPSTVEGLHTGDPVIIENADSPAGNVLNGNVFYVEKFTISGSDFFRLWSNPDLDAPVDIGTTISPSPDATIEYTFDSGVTDKKYTFRLQEQSNDLQILVDGSLHSTIKANGEIHDASGSKYITESDFPTLLQQNAALIKQIVADTSPDYDGGTASTSNFDFTVDGGDASTTEFTDTVEGGNAAGNSIVEGGSSSTTVYASTTDGGNASTTEFDQTIDGGNA